MFLKSRFMLCRNVYLIKQKSMAEYGLIYKSVAVFRLFKMCYYVKWDTQDYGEGLHRMLRIMIHTELAISLVWRMFVSPVVKSKTVNLLANIVVRFSCFISARN